MREPPFDSKQGQKIYIKIYMDFMLKLQSFQVKTDTRFLQ